MSDKTRDLLTAAITEQALSESYTVLAREQKVVIVAVIATESGYRIAHPDTLTRAEAVELLVQVLEKEKPGGKHDG